MDKKTARAKMITQRRIERRINEFAQTTDSESKLELFRKVLAARDNIQDNQQKIDTDRLLAAKVIVIDSCVIENFDRYVAWLGILLDKWAYHDEITFWVGIPDDEWDTGYKEYIQDIVDRNCLEKITVMPYSLMEYLTKGFYSILCGIAQEGSAIEAIDKVREAKKSTLFLVAKV